jgi:hypothetical protein
MTYIKPNQTGEPSYWYRGNSMLKMAYKYVRLVRKSKLHKKNLTNMNKSIRALLTQNMKLRQKIYESQNHMLMLNKLIAITESISYHYMHDDKEMLKVDIEKLRFILLELKARGLQ